MPTRHKSKVKVARPAKAKRPLGGSITVVLHKVRRHLCMSEQPEKDAEKIIRIANKIRVIHDAKSESSVRRGKDGSTVLKEEKKRAAKPAAAMPTLQELIDRVVDNPQAWLSAPNHQFGGRQPRELIGTKEESKLVNLLRAVDLGLF